MRLRSFVRKKIRDLCFDERRARYHFIHIPKNAGQSVRDALCLQLDVSLSTPFHFRYVDIADRVGRHLLFFTVVRNPWSRTASRYQFGRQNAAQWPLDDPRRKFMEKASFADFVDEQRILPIPEHPRQPWMGPLSSWLNQLDWIRDETNRVVCDCLRFEHLGEDIRGYLGRRIALREHNVTRSRYDYRSMYTDRLVESVARLFRDDIEHFGFSFDGAATRNCFAFRG